jgi:hypothetical protein
MTIGDDYRITIEDLLAEKAAAEEAKIAETRADAAERKRRQRARARARERNGAECDL